MATFKVECPATPGIDAQVELAERAIRQPRNPEQRGSGTLLTPLDSELQRISIDFASASLQEIVAGNPGLQIEIYQLFIYQVSAQDLTLFNGATKLMGTLSSFPAQSGFYFNYVGEPHFVLDDGSSFKIQASAAGQVSGMCMYRTRSA